MSISHTTDVGRKERDRHLITRKKGKTIIYTYLSLLVHPASLLHVSIVIYTQ